MPKCLISLCDRANQRANCIADAFACGDGRCHLIHVGGYFIHKVEHLVVKRVERILLLLFHFDRVDKACISIRCGLDAVDQKL